MASEFDRIRSSLMAIVRSVFPRIDYLALYSCKVAKQNADLTLELQPDDARVPGLSNVPLRTFIPGVTVKVSSGARVLLGFAGGDPTQPIAHLWETGTLTQLVVACSDIQLGGGSMEPATLGQTLSTFMTSLKTWLDTHTHVTSCGAGAGTAAAPLPASPTVSNFKSATVQVKT